MEIAIVIIVLFVIALVVFFVTRGAAGTSRVRLGADALAAKFGTAPASPEASHPA